jgi:hypothetical protein
MKKLTFLLIACSILCAVHVLSQENKIDTIKSITDPKQQLKEDLKAGVEDLDSAMNLSDWVSASNHLVLIANKYTDDWAANYYACYSLTVLSYMEKDAKKKDGYLDNAEVYLKKTIEDYKTDYDEIYVLSALYDNARIAVQPMARYKSFGDLFNQNLEKATSLQPNNPRIYYLKGNSVYFTPKMFGGGAKNAMPDFEKAETLYKNESKDDVYKPYWGEVQNQQMLEKCRKEIK